MKGPRLFGILAAIVVVVAAVFWLRPHPSQNRSAAGSNSSVSRVASSVSAPGSNGSLSGGASGSLTSNVHTETIRKAGPAPNAEPLSLVGALVPGAQATLSAAMPARIATVTVQQGDVVRRGQALVLLSLPEVQTQARTAQAGVAAAEAQARKAVIGRQAQLVKSDSDIAAARAGLQQAHDKRAQAVLGRDAARAQAAAERTAAQEGVRKAQAALNQAQETLRGLQRLAQVGGVSQADLEGARTQVTVAQSDLASAQAQARSLQAGPNGSGVSYRVALAQRDADAAQAGVAQAQAGLEAALKAKRQTAALGGQDIRAAEAALAQARAGAVGAESAAAQARLVSPLDGVVVAVNVHAGETAQPGVPLVTVNSRTGLRAEALVPARQLARLRVGQPARVSVDTWPGKSFAAAVAAIAPTAEPNGRTFRVRFNLLNPNGLRPGQTARITVFEP